MRQQHQRAHQRIQVSHLCQTLHLLALSDFVAVLLDNYFSDPSGTKRLQATKLIYLLIHDLLHLYNT